MKIYTFDITDDIYIDQGHFSNKRKLKKLNLFFFSSKTTIKIGGLQLTKKYDGLKFRHERSLNSTRPH